MPLRTKILIAILAAVVVADGLATWVVNDRVSVGARREADRQARAQAAQVRALYEERAATLVAEGEAVSLYPAVIAALADGNARPLQQWSAQVAALQRTKVTVTDGAGRAIARGHAPERAGDELAPRLEGLRRALAGQKASGTEAGDELGMAVRGFAPVLRDGAVVGAVMIADPLDEELLARLGGGSSLTMLPADTRGADGCAPPAAASATCRIGLPTPGGDRAATLALSVPLADIDRAQAEAQGLVWLTGALVLAPGALAAWLLARSLTRPLARLAESARAIGSGDYDRPAPAAGGGEIGVLARAFETMRARVAETTVALRDERDVLDAVLESTGDGILMVDWAGHPAVANGRWRELLGSDGLDRGEDLERLGASGNLADSVREWTADAERALGADFERRSPAYARLRCYSAPVRRRDGAPLGRIVVLRDVTRESAAERMRTALVANVSHELRSPLTSIKGYVDTLLDGGPWDRTTEREFLGIVAHSADRLAGLVENLLDAAKMDAGVLSLEREPVRIERIAQRVVEQRRPLLAATHSLHMDADPDLPLVSADPARVEQVLENLIDNAVKYSPGGGPVTVEARLGGGGVVIRVSDRGVGVAPEQADRLFERFYRGDGQTMRATRGLGLGLFICKSLVEAHGGRIWVESGGPGHGSTFSCLFPALAGEPAPGEQHAPGRLQEVSA